MEKDQQYITNINDRHRLILYCYISMQKSLSFIQRFEFKRLNSIYVDNHLYLGDLEGILFKRGFLGITNSEYRRDENGHYVYLNDLPKETIITELGEKALKSGLLPSETKNAFTNRLKDWSPIIMSFIALIVSIIALIKDSNN